MLDAVYPKQFALSKRFAWVWKMKRKNRTKVIESKPANEWPVHVGKHSTARRERKRKFSECFACIPELEMRANRKYFPSSLSVSVRSSHGSDCEFLKSH